jgi:hypothetical protein
MNSICYIMGNIEPLGAYYLVYLCFETANKLLLSNFVSISILKINQAEHKLSCAEFLVLNLLTILSISVWN